MVWNKEKQLACQRRWYRENSEAHKKQVLKNKQERIKKRKAWLLEQHLKCEHCGENHPVVLDFHHVDPDKKEYHVSKLINGGYSLKRINKEIKKCIVLCSNCHRILHSTMGR